MYQWAQFMCYSFHCTKTPYQFGLLSNKFFLKEKEETRNFFFPSLLRNAVPRTMGINVTVAYLGQSLVFLKSRAMQKTQTNKNPGTIKLKIK